MTDIKPGDYVRVAFEGTVHNIGSGAARRIAARDECTVIDPPVKVGDEISYEQARRLPNKSIVMGLPTGNAYKVRLGDIFYGDRPIYSNSQTFRVLHIPTEATS